MNPTRNRKGTTSSARLYESSGRFRRSRELLNDPKKLASRLEETIANAGLDVHYQPQLDLGGGSCSHMEALVRWNDHEFGPISPAVFIPIAEEYGLIDDVTSFVIRRVKEDVADWRRTSIPVKSVAVNVSAKLLSSEQGAERLLGWLLQGDMTDRSLTLELTETAMVKHKSLALTYMQLLRELGFQLALDDFGTGYSSLSYLLEFPIDVIKIDKSFVSALLHSVKCRTIVRSVMDMSRSLGLQTVAEGVEKEEEMILLQKWGCTLLQGYYFAKPMRKSDVADLLIKMNRAA